MDDDLIPRLRDCCNPLSDAAADEIDRLRARLAESRKWWNVPPADSKCAVSLENCEGNDVRAWMERVDAAMTGETR